MARWAIIRRVMLASPGDTEDLVRAAWEKVYRWNEARHLSDDLLEPVHWKTSAYPSFNTAGAQAEINSQLLDSSDIVIGIFRHRIGTPTATFPSGTVEEILRHKNTGGSAMVYFSNEDVPRELLRSKIAKLQVEKLEKFRLECDTLGVMGDFRNLDDFISKMDRDLTKLIAHRPLNATEMLGALKLRAKDFMLGPGKIEKPEFHFGTLQLDDDVELRCVTFRASSDQGNPFLWWQTYRSFPIKAHSVAKSDICEHMDQITDSFKFYLRVQNDPAIIMKYRNILLECTRAIVAEGDKDPDHPNCWRIWFLHPEGFIHPYMARGYLANHSLCDFSGL